MADTLRLLTTSSRDWCKPLVMWNVFTECHAWARDQGKTLVIVHGDAPGGDQIASLFAQITPGCRNEPHPADWEGPCGDRCKAGHRRKDRRGRDYCPAAGNYRNTAMVALGADRGAAFIRAGSPGATHCARIAGRAGIPVRKYTDG